MANGTALTDKPFKIPCLLLFKGEKTLFCPFTSFLHYWGQDGKRFADLCAFVENDKYRMCWAAYLNKVKMRLQKQFLVRVQLLNRGCQRNAFSFPCATKNVCWSSECIGFVGFCSVVVSFARFCSVLLGHIAAALPNTVSTLFVLFGPRQNFCAFRSVPSIFQVIFDTYPVHISYKDLLFI